MHFAVKGQGVTVARGCACLLAFFGFSFAALAQQAGPKFEITRFEVTGNTLLPAEEASGAVAPFAGANKDFGDVRGAAAALETAYRARGYGVVQVDVPQQEVAGGVVRLRVVEPRVGKVPVEGNVAFDADNVRRSLPAVKEGSTPNTDDVARNLQLANENPYKQTTVLLRAGVSEGVVDVGVRVADEKPWRVYATLDNTGTDSTGNWRSGVGFQHTNFFDQDHTFTAQYITSPSHMSKVSIYGAGYKIPLYRWNSSLELIAGHSNVDSGKLAGLFNVAGSGTVGAVRWNWIPRRWGEVEQKISFGIDYRAFRNQVLFEGESVVPNVTVHPASLTYTGVRRGASSELTFYGSVLANIAGGRNGRQADFEASRTDATSHYKMLRYGLNYIQQLGADFQARIAFNGQYTGNALVSGEQYGIGGPDTVRGYLVREISNDRGNSAQLELYSPELARGLGLADAHRLRLLAFFDAGSVKRNHALPDEKKHDSLSSFGGGVRWNYAKQASLRFDLAHLRQNGSERDKGGLWASVALFVGF